jgi:serine protease Do
MSKRRKNWIFGSVVLALLIIAGSVVYTRDQKAQQIVMNAPSPISDSQKSNASINGVDIASALSESFESASKKVSPSVVPIFAEQQVNVQNPFDMPGNPFRDFFGDDFFKRFFGSPGMESKQTIQSLGSGVIVSEDGYILTNNHVIDGADKLTVILGNNKKYSAKTVGTDPQSDVGVIKIKAKNLPTIHLGNSDNVKVGQWVIAIGNPFQLMHTVTAGIISAKGRSAVGLADYEDFFQTDASINPGNSGGALADLNGDVIGINTAITSPSGGNVGIGFAIPINMAKSVMKSLIAHGKVTRGYLGLLPQDIDENLAKALKIKTTEGALVGDVTKGKPADKAGIKQGDVIIKFNGQKVKNSTDLRNMVAAAQPKSKATIVLIRDGHEKTVDVILGERPLPQKSQSQESQKEEMNTKLGLNIQNLTPEIAKQLGYENEPYGVVITEVKSESAADDAVLKPGDLIKEVNRVAVKSVHDFNKIVAKSKSGDSLALLIRRGNNSFFTAVQIP